MWRELSFTDATANIDIPAIENELDAFREKTTMIKSSLEITGYDAGRMKQPPEIPYKINQSVETSDRRVPGISDVFRNTRPKIKEINVVLTGGNDFVTFEREVEEVPENYADLQRGGGGRLKNLPEVFQAVGSGDFSSVRHPDTSYDHLCLFLKAIGNYLRKLFMSHAQECA